MTIETKVSDQALRQSQRRGISRETLDLVLTYHDRSRKLPGYARALWIGPRGRQALVRAGLPVALIERCAGWPGQFSGGDDEQERDNRLLSNCAGHGFEYTDDEAQQILNAVFDAVHDMKRKFERKKKGAKKGFAFQSKSKRQE